MANGRHFANDIFKWFFLKANACISIIIPLKFVPKRPIQDKSALVQVMACSRTGNKPLLATELTKLHDATRPQQGVGIILH